jgi:hypothetical protein
MRLEISPLHAGGKWEDRRVDLVVGGAAVSLLIVFLGRCGRRFAVKKARRARSRQLPSSAGPCSEPPGSWRSRPTMPT